jgi:putative component of membrane protein insertase Oxa1/YidC/SpoIIIJ protein YidD
MVLAAGKVRCSPSSPCSRAANAGGSRSADGAARCAWLRVAPLLPCQPLRSTGLDVVRPGRENGPPTEPENCFQRWRRATMAAGGHITRFKRRTSLRVSDTAGNADRAGLGAPSGSVEQKCCQRREREPRWADLAGKFRAAAAAAMPRSRAVRRGPHQPQRLADAPGGKAIAAPSPQSLDPSEKFHRPVNFY